MVEFSLKRCGGIFGMLYFDASWLMNSLLTSLTCESNSLKLDVAFAMLPSAPRMANFFLSVSQINDPQAKRTGCKVSSWVRCFPWWRSWLVTIWKVKDELLGPRLHLWCQYVSIVSSVLECCGIVSCIFWWHLRWRDSTCIQGPRARSWACTTQRLDGRGIDGVLWAFEKRSALIHYMYMHYVYVTFSFR